MDPRAYDLNAFVTFALENPTSIRRLDHTMRVIGEGGQNRYTMPEGDEMPRHFMQPHPDAEVFRPVTLGYNK